MILQIDNLPAVVEVGVQDENGVTDIRIDMSPWLDKWPDMEFTVMVTRPGEEESMPVNSTLTGTILSWHINDTDTEIPGEGRMEIIGETPDGKHKKSGDKCATLISGTTTGSTKEPTPAIEPYYKAMLQAAEDVTGGGGLSLVKNGERTMSEIVAAAEAGKTLLYVDPWGRVYTYYGLAQYGDKSEYDGDVPTFFAPIKQESGDSYRQARAQLNPDTGEFAHVSFPVTTPSPNPLNIMVGGKTISYDGKYAQNVEIPSGIEDPGTPHQMLVSDAEGKAVWEEKLAYKTTAVTDVAKDMTLTAMQVTDGVIGMYEIAQPFERNFVAGNTYTVLWGGTEYTSPAVDASALAGAECYMLGDLAVSGEDINNLPFENPAPGSPYLLMYMPGGMDGMYGQFVSVGITPDPPVLSISGEATTVKRIDPEYLTPQITLTIGEDGAVTSNTDFETAWAMSTAQLQAAITVKETQTTSYGYMQPAEVGVVTVRRVESTNSAGVSRVLQIAIGRFTEFNDIPGTSDRTRYILWRHIDGVGTASIWLEEATTQSLPDMTRMPEGKYYVMYDSLRKGWEAITLDQLKADLGLA